MNDKLVSESHCAFCGGDHLAAHCPKFRSPSPGDVVRSIQALDQIGTAFTSAHDLSSECIKRREESDPMSPTALLQRIAALQLELVHSDRLRFMALLLGMMLGIIIGTGACQIGDWIGAR